jgi:hypothetical protein
MCRNLRIPLLLAAWALALAGCKKPVDSYRADTGNLAADHAVTPDNSMTSSTSGNASLDAAVNTVDVAVDSGASNSELPPPAELAAIAKDARATMAQTFEQDGFGSAVQAIKQCYQGLRIDSPPHDRFTCLLRDLAAYDIEQGVPRAYRKADLSTDDYLSKSRLTVRITLNTPPIPRDGDQSSLSAAETERWKANFKAWTEAYDQSR